MADALTRARRGPYRRHFGLVYLLLGAVVGAAVAIFAVLLARPGYQQPPAWSAWRPSGNPDTRIDAIRSFVGSRYVLPTGGVLVGVRAAKPAVQGQPIPAYVIASPTAVKSRYAFVDAKNGLMYSMCGLGSKCSVPGKPSVDRYRVLRREALELALYTFKYVNGVDSVVVFPPPPPKQDPQYALLFKKDALKAELSHPLTATLPRTGNIVVPGPVDPTESAVVDRITAPVLYKFTYRQDPTGDPLLVLAPQS